VDQIAPHDDEKTAASRKTEGYIVCEDWSFCHRKLLAEIQP